MRNLSANQVNGYYFFYIEMSLIGKSLYISLFTWLLLKNTGSNVENLPALLFIKMYCILFTHLRCIVGFWKGFKNLLSNFWSLRKPRSVISWDHFGPIVWHLPQAVYVDMLGSFGTGPFFNCGTLANFTISSFIDMLRSLLFLIIIVVSYYYF